MGETSIQRQPRRGRIPKELAAQVETWRNNLVDADTIVDDARRDLTRVIRELRAAKTERDRCAAHLQHLVDWADEAPHATPLPCAVPHCAALASRRHVYCAAHRRHAWLRRRSTAA